MEQNKHLMCQKKSHFLQTLYTKIFYDFWGEIGSLNKTGDKLQANPKSLQLKKATQIRIINDG